MVLGDKWGLGQSVVAVRVLVGLLVSIFSGR